jgi:hypothetical protein
MQDNGEEENENETTLQLISDQELSVNGIFIKCRSLVSRVHSLEPCCTSALHYF